MKLTPLARTLEVRADAYDKRKRMLRLSVSSETPVHRWFGTEILDHDKKSVRLARFNGGANVLFNHDPDDVIGVVERAWLENRRLMADVRLAKSARGEEVAGMVEDDILRNVSVGYRIYEVVEKAEEDEYRAIDWEPYELSIVTVPADPTVGIGRTIDLEEREVKVSAPTVSTPPKGATSERSTTMTEKVASAAPAGEPAAAVVAEPKAPAPTQLSAVELEGKRKSAIINLCRANKIDERIERQWIESGADMHEVSEGIVKVLVERGKDNATSVARLDLSAGDRKRYSLMRALRASVNKSWNAAGFELECNTEISKRLHRLPRAETSFFVPLDVLMADLPGGKRDMTVAGVSGSNYLVSTDNMPGSFIDLLRNTSVALRMGATRMAGLVGNVTIPKMTAGNSAYWLADESTQITESQPTIGQLALAPKNVAALTELSHQLMQQSTPDAESLVLTSIARDIGLAVDVGILRGSGTSGQPTGIVNTAGIGSVSGTSLAAAGVLEFQSDVAANNALLPGCGYVTTPAVASLLMVRPELPNTGTTRLWMGNMLQGSLFNMPAMSSAQMSAGTMLFGYWPAVILAEWGVLELMTNPFSDFTRGLTAVRGWYTCDVGVRYPGGFSYASSIT
jgi:HK97 family phage major capsid protein/HK97 family phage prohead protease